jgi:hypothetical protein
VWSAGTASLSTFAAVASHGVLDTFTDAGRGVASSERGAVDAVIALRRYLMAEPGSWYGWVASAGFAPSV